MVRTALVQVLLFIAAVSASTLFVGVVVTEAGLYAQSAADESDRDASTLDAEIEIINHPEAGTTYDEDAEQVIIYTKNVGDGSIDPGAAELLLDGEYVQPTETRVLESSTTTWREETVLELTAPASFDPGDHRIVVDADGARDHLEFEHRIADWTTPSVPSEFNSTTENCGAEECTVVLNETDDEPELELNLRTEPQQPDTSVSYASSNATVGSFGSGSDETIGTTDSTGSDTIRLSLGEPGETTVTFDTGWDDGDITIHVTESDEE